jgi:hypothetical protein
MRNNLYADNGDDEALQADHGRNEETDEVE